MPIFVPIIVTPKKYGKYCSLELLILSTPQLPEKLPAEFYPAFDEKTYY